MLLKARVRSSSFQHFFRLITKYVVDEGVDLLVKIYFFQVTEKTACKVSISHTPFLDGPDSAFWFFADSFFVKIFSERVGQPVVKTDIGLKMVVDFLPLDSIENGIDVCLPLVRWFKFPKGYQIWRVGHGRESVEIFIR